MEEVGPIPSTLYKKKKGYTFYHTLMHYGEPDTGYLVFTDSYADNAPFLMNPTNPADVSGDFGQLTMDAPTGLSLGDLFFLPSSGTSLLAVSKREYGRTPAAQTIYRIARRGSVLTVSAAGTPATPIDVDTPNSTRTAMIGVFGGTSTGSGNKSSRPATASTLPGL